MIILWQGPIASIPGGWVLCNGENGTPNLDKLFVMAAGDTVPAGATGGALTHTHDFIGVAQSTSMQPGPPQDHYGAPPNMHLVISAPQGTTDAGDSLPSYYALCYIMKL